MKKLLLHTCCGPCFLGTLEDKKIKEYEITNLFYNPNIYPEEEYKKRLENLKKIPAAEVLELEYEPKQHQEAIKGQEKDFPKRCLNCYRLRLERTAKEAKDNHYDAFSTTLLVSPHQQHDQLKAIGEELAKKYNIEFFYEDFRPYFRQGQEKAKELEIYRQKYCGCQWSLE